jgi:hypothetical protein
MTHRRAPSEGLNIGEGFPTSYSTFAVSADSRGNDSSRSTTSQAKKGSTQVKRRSSPPFDSLKSEGSLKTYSGAPVETSSTPKITFESSSKSSVSTAKSWETTVKSFYKRWKFVVFFLSFSALIVCGTLLPVSRGKTSLRPKSASAVKRDNILHKQVRSVRETSFFAMGSSYSWFRWQDCSNCSSCTHSCWSR